MAHDSFVISCRLFDLEAGRKGEVFGSGIFPIAEIQNGGGTQSAPPPSNQTKSDRS
jgi:hypothetical protein